MRGACSSKRERFACRSSKGCRRGGSAARGGMRGACSERVEYHIPTRKFPPPGSAATSQACESSTRCLHTPKPPSLPAKDSPLLSQNLEAQPPTLEAQHQIPEAQPQILEAQLQNLEAQLPKRPKVAQVDWQIAWGTRFLTPWARKAVRLRISEAALRGFGQRAPDGAQRRGVGGRVNPPL